MTAPAPGPVPVPTALAAVAAVHRPLRASFRARAVPLPFTATLHHR